MRLARSDVPRHLPRFSDLQFVLFVVSSKAQPSPRARCLGTGPRAMCSCVREVETEGDCLSSSCWPRGILRHEALDAHGLSPNDPRGRTCQLGRQLGRQLGLQLGLQICSKIGLHYGLLSCSPQGVLPCTVGRTRLGIYT